MNIVGGTAIACVSGYLFFNPPRCRRKRPPGDEDNNMDNEEDSPLELGGHFHSLCSP